MAYERARDLDSVVRISLDNLNQPQKAFQLVRETKLPSGAERVAEYCRKNGNVAGAVEFYLLAKNDEAQKTAKHWCLMVLDVLFFWVYFWYRAKNARLIM